MLMKAIVCTKYGSPDVLQLKEVNRPIPGDRDLLIKVETSTATRADTMMRKADPFISRFFLGLMKPKNTITGTGFAGRVESVGKEVTRFAKGNSVFGETGVTFGANAEYVRVSEDGVLETLPTNMTFEDAAPLCDGALTSLNFLKEIGDIKPGQNVLINGASGSLGTAAVQLAKRFGAEVTGVCSAKNLELVKSLGANHVIDYTKTDFTRSDKRYDIIYDTVGKLSFRKCKASLTAQGVFLSPVLQLSLLFQMIRTSLFGTKKAKFSATGLLPAPKLRSFLKELVNLIEDGQLKTVIDRRFKLAQAAEAHRFVDTGHKTGNVVIIHNDGSESV